MRWALTIVTVLAGCIEGPESKNAIYSISPRPCETDLPADQTFELEASADDFAQLAHDPPRFAVETPDGRIDMETTVELGTLALRPLSPLPATDFTLALVDPRALGPNARGTDLFPARYSGQAQGVIRSYRAAQNQVYVSFSKALDAASVASAVTVKVVGLPVTATADYVESPGHIVHVSIGNDARPVDITFATSLRAADGTGVFDTARTIQVDPVSAVPAYDGCESSTL